MLKPMSGFFATVFSLQVSYLSTPLSNRAQ